MPLISCRMSSSLLHWRKSLKRTLAGALVLPWHMGIVVTGRHRNVEAVQARYTAFRSVHGARPSYTQPERTSAGSSQARRLAEVLDDKIRGKELKASISMAISVKSR
jgi:hypothetical protein